MFWKFREYAITVLTCQPADPASKGGVESSVKVAKADIVPKDTNLRPKYTSFAEVEAACKAFMDTVNNREHRHAKKTSYLGLRAYRRRLPGQPHHGC